MWIRWAKLWLWGSISQSLRQNNHMGVNRLLFFSRLRTSNLRRSSVKKKKKKGLTIFFSDMKSSRAWEHGHGHSTGLNGEDSVCSLTVGLQPHSHPTALTGCVFPWGHRAACSTNVQRSPSCWEGKEGIKPGSCSVWGSAHLYLGETTAALHQRGRQQTTVQILLCNSWLLCFWDVHSFFWKKSPRQMGVSSTYRDIFSMVLLSHLNSSFYSIT